MKNRSKISLIAICLPISMLSGGAVAVGDAKLHEQAERLARDSDFVMNDDGSLRLDVREQFLFVERMLNNTTNDEFEEILSLQPLL